MSTEGNISVLLGDPKKALRMMSLPLMLSLLVTEINSIADRAWCSGLGTDALAAIAVVTPIYFVLMGLGNGLGVGAASTIARYIGAEDRKNAEGCARHALVFSIVFGLVLTPFLVLFCRDILVLIGSGDVTDPAYDYMITMVAFTSVLIMNGVVCGMLRGEGAARAATAIMLITACTNVILDPILIYTFDLGISGASYATVISTTLSTLVGLALYASGHTYIRIGRRVRYDPEQLRSVLSVGVPQMMEFTVMYAMNIVLNYIVLWCAGSTGLTIYSVPNVLMNLAVIPTMAIGSALVPVASAAYGQNDAGKMGLAYRYSLTLSIVLVLALTIFMFAFPDQLLYIFTYSGETELLRAEMTEAMRIYCLYLPFFALIPIGSSMLQAIRMPNRSVICAVVRNLILIALYAVAATDSLYMIFWAVVVGEVIGGFMMYFVAGASFRKVSKTISS